MFSSGGCSMKSNPLLWISKFWLEFEALLVEAVQRNSRAGVELLLEYEDKLQNNQLSIKDEGKKFRREKDSAALILAARNGNNQLMKLFIDKQYTIAPPHLIDCQCLKCQSNKLGQSKKRMETLQALSDPIWISLTSEDPFLTAFKLSKMSRKFSFQDDCFEGSYRELDVANQQFCLGLMNEIESEDEGCCLMAHKKICEYVTNHKTSHPHTHPHCDDVSFVNLAIEYGQKEVVAHPIAQHFVTSIVFDNIPRWRTSSLYYKIFFIVVTAFFFPVTTLASIFLPCSAIGRIGLRPLVKFINVAASFITFLILLAWMVASKNNDYGIMSGHTPTKLEIIVFIWLIGLIVGEIQQLNEHGVRDYFSSGWNFIDISMMALMIISYITWTVLFGIEADKTTNHFKDVYNLVDGLFALAIILSFFRLVYLMQITRYLGLLQLCLGEMIQVIFQFAFISVVVLCSFAVAMAFLCHSSDSYRDFIAAKHNETDPTTDTAIYRLLNVSYDGLPATMITLMWASLNMVTIKSLKGLDDGTFVHLWSHLLFGLYYCASMIVLLNMLIAMMSNSYQRIVNNLEVEHKFSRTVLWVDYIGDDNARPVPFNLIPTLKSFKSLCGGTAHFFKRVNSRMRRDKKPELNKAAHVKYRGLCNLLVDRCLIKKYGFNYNEDKENSDKENASFVRKVKLQCMIWTSKCKTENKPADPPAPKLTDHLYTAVEGQWDSMEKNMLYTSEDHEDTSECTSNC